MLRAELSRNHPMVLVVDQAETIEQKALSSYFSQSSLEIYEASDEFDVIDELCDFTVRGVPDVITVSMKAADFTRITALISHVVGAGSNPPVFLYSDSLDVPSTFHSINEIDEWFNGQESVAVAGH